MDDDLRGKITKTRQDLSDWVWHFTRRDRQPLQTLLDILASGHIRGTTDRFCTEPSVCLTEMPLTEAMRQSSLLDNADYTRMSDYGIGFKKSWVFGKGGLPVIYQPANMKEALPAEMRWRHCDLDFPRGIDFTWQREWRVPGAQLKFEQTDDLIVVLATEEEAMIQLCDDFGVDAERDEFFYTVNWSYITHEALAASKVPTDVEVSRVHRG